MHQAGMHHNDAADDGGDPASYRRARSRDGSYDISTTPEVPLSLFAPRPGVYSILRSYFCDLTNRKTIMKVYIGASGHVHKGLSEHIAALKLGTHPNKALQDDFER